MPYILQTSHLGKMINGKELVTDVNIHVKKGEIYGFLGPNGAGKTTVMKMVTSRQMAQLHCLEKHWNRIFTRC